MKRCTYTYTRCQLLTYLLYYQRCIRYQLPPPAQSLVGFSGDGDWEYQMFVYIFSTVTCWYREPVLKVSG